MITASTVLKTEFGNYKVCFHEIEGKHLVSFSYGNISKDVPIVRFHSACLFGEAFHSLHCDCAQQITKIMSLIQKNKVGVIIYSFHEGRGIGLKNKIKAMELERLENLDTIEAFKKLGFEADYRDYNAEVEVLRDLRLNRTIKTFSGSPKKIDALKQAGYIIREIISGKHQDLSDRAKRERKVKIKKLGYKY